MSPLTYWHYLLIFGLGLTFILGVVLALRSDSKFSVFASISVILAVAGIFLWASINQSVYHVEVSRLDDKHLYQTEQLLITGVVTNTGEFPVAHVIGTVKLINARSVNAQKASQFGQPTAFAELYKGDNPSFRPQNVISKHVIADYLDPGNSKTFTIILDYPPYFKNASYEVDGSVY